MSFWYATSAAEAAKAGIHPLVATLETPVPLSPAASTKAPPIESPKQSKKKQAKFSNYFGVHLSKKLDLSGAVLPLPDGCCATTTPPTPTTKAVCDAPRRVPKEPETLLFTIEDVEKVLQNEPTETGDLMLGGISVSRKRDRSLTDDELDHLFESMYEEIVALRRNQKPRGMLQVSSPDLFCESWADATSGYSPTSSDKIGILVRRPVADGMDFPFGVRRSREGVEWHATCKVVFQVRFCTGVKTTDVTTMRLVLVRDGEDTPVDPRLFGKALVFKTSTKTMGVTHEHFDAPLVDGVVEFRGVHFAVGVSSSVVTGSKNFRFMCTSSDPTNSLRAYTPKFQITSNPRSKTPFKEQDAIDATLN